MNIVRRQNPGKGIVEAVLDDAVSEEEMDRLLTDRVDEVNVKLAEARAERERGDLAPLEPLHVLLQAGRDRLQRKNKR
jgi:hypothetical protein